MVYITQKHQSEARRGSDVIMRIINKIVELQQITVEHQRETILQGEAEAEALENGQGYPSID